MHHSKETDKPADDMVLEIRGGEDQFLSSVSIFRLSLSTSDAEADEMVAALRGGCSDGVFLDDYSTSESSKKSYGLLQGSGSSPNQFMQVADFSQSIGGMLTRQSLSCREHATLP